MQVVDISVASLRALHPHYFRLGRPYQQGIIYSCFYTRWSHWVILLLLLYVGDTRSPSISSNINEVIKKVISSLFIFFIKRFYTQKKHKIQTSDFHSDVFIRLKSIKSKQATFTHKKHKTSNKLRFRRF